MADHSAWLILNRCPGLGASRICALHREFGSGPAILDRPPTQLRQFGLDDSAVRFLKTADKDKIAADLGWLKAADHHLLTLDDADYPVLLRKIADPPPVLYASGDPGVLAMPQLAVVGSRHPTPLGKDTAYEFSRYLARAGLTITSGLALGIDAAAHRGALAGGGKTVAVCGTGPDQIYPAANIKLARELSASGVLISEFPVATPARKHHFPQRNRIISGLTLGTLVVEAARRSGSLITARLAAEQGREVFAIPGSIHSPLSRGCHRLIRDGAKLVETVGDIYEELAAIAGVVLETGDSEAPETGPETAPDLDEDYVKLLELMGLEPVGVDLLIERSGLTAEEVSSMLLIMELKGHVESTPDGRYGRRIKRPQ